MHRQLPKYSHSGWGWGWFWFGSGSGAAPEVARSHPPPRRLSSSVHHFRLPSPPLIWKVCMVWSLLSAIARFLRTTVSARWRHDACRVDTWAFCQSFSARAASAAGQLTNLRTLLTGTHLFIPCPVSIEPTHYPGQTGQKIPILRCIASGSQQVPNRLAWKLELDLDLELLRLTPSSTWSRGSSLCR
ncbi:hypothetical protein CKAH01_01447 [Colletotrichum kahawae]|uniref:Uncharacterized protein n=1 Tax=Colletotrichum kahawae TaxID=34407 RepID=A0AAD9Y663_COLKA|nr:hypothetical protein CKAH01_01447 [Colletotrichum kahawae]